MSTRLSITSVAKLANLSLDKKDAAKFQQAFDATIAVVGNLAELETKNIAPTHQVTGLENRWRQDLVKPSLTQDQALANAKHKHNGFFVVDRIIDHD